jgi:glycosyltransferase involved in cell wall biosynthesis
VELVGAGRVEAVEFHHPHGHDPAIFALAFQFGVPVDVFIHDYILFCPRIALVGGQRRYCGEPALRHCEACIADVGPIIEEDIGVAALRARAASLLGRARRVIAPSRDVAARIAHHFPRITPVVEPWEDDTTTQPFQQRQRVPGDRALGDTVRVAVIGAIGLHKGYDVLLACARDAARSGLNLFFTVVGHTIDDRRLMATGRVFVTGPFAEGEAEALIRSHRNDVALLPSIWPETWCFTLTEAWRAGLAVVAFDIGTPAERIRRTGGGTLLPLGATPKSVNNALLALAGATGHE